ncbi:MAG TPA: class I SAM-dependent methyltransferase, partial [Desulfosalsimonadaceae bacterium]|nr:class I SAM-dependent methyltransferase [Desulfosalsimonadaceae bacterium]
MTDRKFNPRHIDILNDPQRKKTMKPDTLWELVNLDNPGVLVDVGAGTGFFACLFAEKMAGGTVYACDTSDELIAWMQENLSSACRERVIPVKSEEAAIPLADDLADLAYMINLHHELERPQELLVEVRRLVKPGGKVLIVDWKPEETPEGPPLSIRVPPAT